MKKKIKLSVLKIPQLKIPQLKLPKFFKFKGINNSLKSFYYTCVASLIIILFFFLSPTLVLLKNNLLVKSIEVKNESKSNLEKVLSGKKTKEEQDLLSTYIGKDIEEAFIDFGTPFLDGLDEKGFRKVTFKHSKLGVKCIRSFTVDKSNMVTGFKSSGCF